MRPGIPGFEGDDLACLLPPIQVSFLSLLTGTILQEAGREGSGSDRDCGLWCGGAVMKRYWPMGAQSSCTCNASVQLWKGTLGNHEWFQSWESPKSVWPCMMIPNCFSPGGYTCVFCMCVRVCVCVRERERERERDPLIYYLKSTVTFRTFSPFSKFLNTYPYTKYYHFLLLLFHVFIRYPMLFFTMF